jgi:aspartate/tyrosine/aromatic aminotransferase
VELLPTKKLILVIDYAFIGMAKGLDEDFLPIRKLAEKAKSMENAVPFLVAISLSKGFTLYNERVGLSYAVSSYVFPFALLNKPLLNGTPNNQVPQSARRRYMAT